MSNRETFDALPRWFSELETYVSESVVKVIVGNKVDKESRHCILIILAHADFTQEYSRQVPAAEAEAFAHRMGCLFVEASAKTSVGVREAFRNVVEQIIDTPELWGNAAKSGGGASGRKAPAAVSNQTMPGTIDLSGDSEGEQGGGGCGC